MRKEIKYLIQMKKKNLIVKMKNHQLLERRRRRGTMRIMKQTRQ